MGKKNSPSKKPSDRRPKPIVQGTVGKAAAQSAPPPPPQKGAGTVEASSSFKESAQISAAKVDLATKTVPVPQTHVVVDAATKPTAPVATSADPDTVEKDKPAEPETWSSLFKSKSKTLEKKGTPFSLPSGESCVLIPNSLIEKNKHTWKDFIIGQFYNDPPAQNTIQNIVNGIWSRHAHDIIVSKMEGFAFLFKIPNPQTRARVVAQRLWQIEGQTMLVADWEPGIIPKKPELTSAPIWLELRNVPLQFFNDDCLERIAVLKQVVPPPV